MTGALLIIDKPDKSHIVSLKLNTPITNILSETKETKDELSPSLFYRFLIDKSQYSFILR